MNRNATQLWNLMTKIEARAIRSGQAVRGGRHGISFKGAYRKLMNEAATRFERMPYEDRAKVYFA